MSFITRTWKWLKKVFKDVKEHAAPLAVTITEHIKEDLQSGAAGFIAGIVDMLTGQHIASEIVAIAKANIQKVLTVELAVQGLPDNPTEADILKFETDVINAFGKLDNKSKLYTTLAAQIYGIIKTTVETTPDQKPTFAEWVAAVETAWQDYQQDLIDNPQ